MTFSPGHTSRSIWTSGIKFSNRFYWMGNGKQFIFTKFVTPKPYQLSATHEPEDCFELRYNNNFDWNDVRCSTYHNKILCERYSN